MDILQKMTALDRAIESWVADYRRHDGRLHCGRGCSNCCSLYVRITAVEALHIADKVTQEQLERLQTYVDKVKQLARNVESMKDFLYRERFEVGNCPFLDGEGACEIYTDRPLACRALLSTRPADWCGVDFSSLHPLEKEAFRISLNRQVVAWPTHYVEATQRMAEGEEGNICEWMGESWGYSLFGSLGYIVWLLRNEGIRSGVTDMAAFGDYFAAKEREFPYLLTIKRIE